MSGNLIDEYPVTAKAIMADVPPPELVREVALKPSLRRIRDATVKLAQITRAREIEQANKLIIDNHSTTFKSVNGLGEFQGRVPMRMLMENAARIGLPKEDWWRQENINNFFKDNPQFKVRITRGTRGQEILK